MKYSLSLSLFFIIVIIIFVIQKSDQTLNDAEKLNKQEGVVNNNPSKITEAIPLEQRKSNGLGENLTPQHLDRECVELSEYTQDIRHEVMDKWMVENLMTSNLNTSMSKYSYAGEELLIEYAESGDAKAMWSLGINYRWNSRYENFLSPFLKPTDVPFPEYVAKPLNIAILDKSRYWFEQAAINGLISGLVELDITYTIELNLISSEKADQIERTEEIKLDRLVNKKLIKTISPQFADLMNNFTPGWEDKSELSSGAQAILEDKLNKKIKNWNEARRKKGLQLNYEILIPEEVKQLNALHHNLCN